MQLLIEQTLWKRPFRMAEHEQIGLFFGRFVRIWKKVFILKTWVTLASNSDGNFLTWWQRSRIFPFNVKFLNTNSLDAILNLQHVDLFPRLRTAAYWNLAAVQFENLEKLSNIANFCSYEQYLHSGATHKWEGKVYLMFSFQLCKTIEQYKKKLERKAVCKKQLVCMWTCTVIHSYFLPIVSIQLRQQKSPENWKRSSDL